MKRRQTPIYSALIDVNISIPKIRSIAVSSRPENISDKGISPNKRDGMANIPGCHDLQAQALGAPVATEVRVPEVDTSLPMLPSPSAVIRLSRASHNFGEVCVGDYEFWILALHNEGESDGIINDISWLPLMGFSLLELPVLPIAIPPHGTQVITVRYAPDLGGNKSAANLSITTNDPVFSIQKVLLTGIGVTALRNEVGGNFDKSMD